MTTYYICRHDCIRPVKYRSQTNNRSFIAKVTIVCRILLRLDVQVFKSFIKQFDILEKVSALMVTIFTSTT